jgi:hypothetical protein
MRNFSIRHYYNVQCVIEHRYRYTPLAVVSRARKTVRVSTTATIAQIPAVSSKEGAVIGAVLSTRKSHRGGVITDITMQRHIELSNTQ